MQQQLHTPTVICEEYDNEHSCITIEEVRWLLRNIKRYSPYWTYFVLRLTTGMRPDEAVKITLYNLSPDCRTITYRVDKPATRLVKDVGYVQRRKHRRVVLDEWTTAQLKEYLNRTCRLVDGVYVSPYQGQKLFPWSSMMVVGAYWYKLRKKMRRSGFDAFRTAKVYLRQGRVHKVYIVRPHILRHFSASVMACKLGSVISVRDWIKHDDSEITNGYLHSAEALGTTPDYLKLSTWATILGYNDEQATLPEGKATVQTSLDCY